MKKMKKLLAVLLAMVMMFGLAAGGIEAAATSGKYSNMSFAVHLPLQLGL